MLCCESIDTDFQFCCVFDVNLCRFLLAAGESIIYTNAS